VNVRLECGSGLFISQDIHLVEPARIELGEVEPGVIREGGGVDKVFVTATGLSNEYVSSLLCKFYGSSGYLGESVG